MVHVLNGSAYCVVLVVKWISYNLNFDDNVDHNDLDDDKKMVKLKTL